MQSRDKCLFLHYKVEEQPRKSFQHGKGDDKSAAAIVKTLPRLGYVSQDSEPSEFPKRMKYRGRVRFTVYAASSKYPRKSRTVKWKNTSQTSSSAKSVRCEV